MGASIAKLWPKCFFFLIYVQTDRIEEPQRTFYPDRYFLYYIFHNEWTKENQRNWNDHCEETCNQSGSFEDTAKFNWDPVESFENRRCQCIFVTVCDNPGKCVFNTLQFMHVQTSKTPEENVAVIKATTHQGISHQDSSLISQILSNQPELTHLNVVALYHFQQFNATKHYRCYTLYS